MSPTPEFKKKLKTCEPEIRDFVANLQLENAKLQRKIAKLEAEKISSDNMVRALGKELKKSKPSTQIIIQTTPELKKLMTEN